MRVRNLDMTIRRLPLFETQFVRLLTDWPQVSGAGDARVEKRQISWNSGLRRRHRRDAHDGATGAVRTRFGCSSEIIPVHDWPNGRARFASGPMAKRRTPKRALT